MDYKRCEMDIRVLRYFLAVAREESFTGAADSLMASQPTLSKQIAQLERELGKKLFERGGRRVTLTEDGMLLYRRAEEIIALVGRTEREFKSDEHDVSGEVAVGGHIPRFLLKAAARTHEAHRGVRFYWHNGDAADVSERLQQGRSTSRCCFNRWT
ncbi:LysR family transcriptional regulator [Bifidobacterium longum]|nr:LysR family transcriptional regulator [Bifidobacterium longum]